MMRASIVLCVFSLALPASSPGWASGGRYLTWVDGNGGVHNTFVDGQFDRQQRQARQRIGQSPQAQRFQQAAQAPGGDAQIVQRFRVGTLDDPGIGMHDLDFEAGNGANHGCGESHAADSRNWSPKSRTCCRSVNGSRCARLEAGRSATPATPRGYICASAYSASTERGTPCRVTCTPWGKSLKRSVR